MKNLARSLTLLAPLLLGACGFHAAGSRALPDPLKRVRIDMVAPYRVSEPPVETALRTRLIQRGAEVVEEHESDITVIRLKDLRATREVLSVGPDGKALEYELILRANYDVRTGTRVWVMPTAIEVRRDYSFNAQQVLAKEQEADRLREYLEGEMAEILLLRIEAAAARVDLLAPEPDAAPESQATPAPTAAPATPAEGQPAAAPAPAEAPPAAVAEPAATE